MTTTATTTVESPLEDIVSFMRRFVAFPEPEQADVCAMWVLHTWAFDSAYATPYLYVTSAEKQSGKTRLMEVLSLLARNSIVTASMSGSSLFRTVEKVRPTLFIDEVDTVFTGASNEDLRGILNSGYKKNGTVMRTVGEDAMTFSTFCPKLLAGIDNAGMPDTIADRCIRIVLKRKRTGEEVERFIERKIETDVAELVEKIEKWVAANSDKLAEAEPKVIEEISDRAFEISESLLAIADRTKGWHKRGRDAIIKLMKREESPLSLQAQALLNARELFEENGGDKVFSASIAERLNVTPKRLGVLLAPYGIKPTTIRIGGMAAKGYFKRDFQDAWERYLVD